MFKKSLPLLIAVIFSLVLRIPTFFEPYWYGDEGIYLTIGQAIRRGALLYRDIWDNKPPLLYLIYAIYPTLLWAKIAATLSVILSLGALFKLSQLFFNNKINPLVITLILSSLLLNLPLFEGNVANGELFMITPALWGLYLALTTIRPLRLFLAGFLFGLAFLIKVPIALDFTATLLFLFFVHQIHQKDKSLLSSLPQFAQNPLLPLTLGFFAPFLFTLFYFYLNNALADYHLAAFSQNLTYTSFGNTVFSSNDLLFIKAAILVSYVLVVTITFKKAKPPPPQENSSGGDFSLFPLHSSLFFWLWFGFAAYGVLLGGRSYAHYLHQLIPPLSFLLGSFFFNLKREILLRKISQFLALLVLMTFLLNFQFKDSWQISLGYNLDYYQNFLQHALGLKPQGAYFDFFDRRTNRTYQTAQYLKNRTAPDETIFIWGDESLLYALANRPPSSRFIATHHLPPLPSSFDEVITKLKKVLPAYIVIRRPLSFDFPKLEIFVGEDYNLVAAFEDLYVYQKKAAL